MPGHGDALVADIGTCCMTTDLISPAEVLNYVRAIHRYLLQTARSVRGHSSETGDRDSVGGRSSSSELRAGDCQEEMSAHLDQCQSSITRRPWFTGWRTLRLLADG